MSWRSRARWWKGSPTVREALLIEGDAGIGKTAVWRAALELSGRALVCVADEADARLSFSGLADLLGEVADAVLPALPPPQREALEVALVRRVSASGHAPDPMAAGVALRAVLEELATDGPLVIAVDDAQWLEPATARVLAFAMRRLHGLPVGMLATVRAPLTAADPLGLERAFGERLRRVRLAGLGVGALRAILQERLGRAYCATDPAADRARLRRQSAVRARDRACARSVSGADARRSAARARQPEGTGRRARRGGSAGGPRRAAGGRGALATARAAGGARGISEGSARGRGRRARARRRRPRAVRASAVCVGDLRRGGQRTPARAARAAGGARPGPGGARPPPRARDGRAR